MSVAREEKCRAILDERNDATSPVYRRYWLGAQAIIRGNTFPTWRVSADGARYIEPHGDPRGRPITYGELSKKPHLLDVLKFDVTHNYLTTRRIISFHCSSCGVHVVKDGNHRLLQCVVKDVNPDIEVYEVVSADWSAGQVDMKYFCRCNRVR